MFKTNFESFIAEGCDKTTAQRIVKQANVIQGICSMAAVDCIKESNSIEECISFANINPTPYVLLMADARIRQILSSGKKSIVIGGHENNE